MVTLLIKPDLLIGPAGCGDVPMGVLVGVGVAMGVLVGVGVAVGVLVGVAVGVLVGVAVGVRKNTSCVLCTVFPLFVAIRVYVLV
jgi:hypothetical protein